MKNKLLLFLLCLFILSCGNDEKSSNQKGLKKLAYGFYSELTFKQRLDALLLLSDNDTAKVCYALVMPKQTFKRLSKEETYPTSLAKTKTNDLYVNSVMSHGEYLDSLSKNGLRCGSPWIAHQTC